MLRRKLLCWALMLLLFAPPSLALNFTVAVEYPPRLIAGESYEGFLLVKNLDKEKGFLSVSILGPRPEWVIPEKKILALDGGKERKVKLYFRPSPDAYEATYRLRVYVKAHDGSEKSAPLPLTVVQPKKIRFSELKLSCEKCRPEERVRASFTVTNLGVEKREFEVIFRAFGLDKKVRKKVRGRSREDFAVVFDVSKYQAPGKYSVTAEVYDENGEKIKTLTKTFEVAAVENVSVSQREKKSIFDRTVEIRVRNEGNLEKSCPVYSNASSSLLSIYLGPKIERRDGVYFFTVKVKPGEEKIVRFKEFYWYRVAVILALIAVAVYLKFFYISGIKIRKRIIYTPPLREGKAVGVSIELKTSKPIKRIVVRDFVPPSFELVKSFETLKPMRKNAENGIELVWKVRSMRAGEERVFHYKVKPKIGVIGKIKLSRASVKFELDGREGEKRSNSPEAEGVKEI